jgi:hypothetical protein
MIKIIEASYDMEVCSAQAALDLAVLAKCRDEEIQKRLFDVVLYHIRNEPMLNAQRIIALALLIKYTNSSRRDASDDEDRHTDNWTCDKVSNSIDIIFRQLNSFYPKENSASHLKELLSAISFLLDEIVLQYAGAFNFYPTTIAKFQKQLDELPKSDAELHFQREYVKESLTQLTYVIDIKFITKKESKKCFDEWLLKSKTTNALSVFFIYCSDTQEGKACFFKNAREEVEERSINKNNCSNVFSELNKLPVNLTKEFACKKIA